MIRRLATLAFLLCSAPSYGFAQAAPASCPPALAAAFRFLVGRWVGTVYNLAGNDSTPAETASVTARQLFDGCALEENWHYEKNGVTEVDDVVLRAYDAASDRWSYDLVTSHVEHVTFAGVRDGALWHFERDVVADGKPVRVRLTWVPTTWGYSEQIARSTDAGRTWTSTRHIHFRRDQR